jgi:hypothetical protein
MLSQVFIKKFGGLFLLIALSAVAHWQWLVLPGLFTSGDYWYIPNQIFEESLTAPKILNGDTSLVTGISQPTFALLNFIGGLLTKTHLGFGAWERILFLWPIALLAPIPIYLLLLKTLRYPAGAFAGSLIYLFNTYILAREMMHLHIVIVYFLAPLLFLSVRELLHKQTKRSILLFIAITTVCSIFEIRIVYILTFMLIGYAIYLLTTHKITLSWKMVRVILYAIIPVALLQAYWLLPFIFANSSLGYESIISRSLFRSYYHVAEALTLSDPFWSGKELTDFIPQQIFRWEYLVPIIAFLWLIIRPTTKKNAFFWFWSFIALVGVFLVKQENNPFPQAYSWLFAHFPGFKLFRESSKFSIIPALAFASLVPGSLLLLRTKYSKVASALIFGICVVMLAHIIPLAHGDIKAMTTPFSIRQDFTTANTMLSQNGDFGRTLWIPSTERFISASQTHPRLSLADLASSDWKPFFPEGATLTSIPANPIFKSLLNFGSIQYIGEPASQIDNVFQLYNASKSEIQKNISAIQTLKPITETSSEMPIWQNPDAKPHIYLANNVIAVHGPITEFSGIDPSKQSAFIFKSSLSDNSFQQAEKTVATNAEYLPFSVQNLSIQQGKVTTKEDLNTTTPLNTITTKGIQDTIVPISVISSDTTLSLVAKTTTGDITLATTPNTHHDYAITINDTSLFYKNNIESQDFPLGTIRLHTKDNEITFLEKINTDQLVEDPSFESGTWGEAGDCNNFDSTSKAVNEILATQSDKATDGNHSLLLSAKNHIACAQAKILATSTPTTYIGSIDYQYQKDNPGYIKIINPDSGQLLSSSQFNNQTDWQHENFSFDMEAKQQSSIFLYQPSGAGLFDNLHLDAYTKISSRSVDFANNTQTITSQPYQPGDTTIEDSTVTGKNLLKQETFSLDMQFSAGDCNNENNTTVDQNGIRASITPTNNNEYALSIQASDHIACLTLPLTDFTPTYDNFLSVTYRTISGDNAHITFYPNNDTPRASVQLPNTGGQWKTINTIINGSYIKSNASLIIYIPSDGTMAQTQFQSLSVVQVPIISPRFIQTTNPPLPDIAFSAKDIDSTMHTVYVPNIETTPRLLVLSDRFDPGWRVFVRNADTKNQNILQRALLTPPGIEIAQDSHIKANAFTNGWTIDPQEIQTKFGSTTNVELVIQYWPQRYMDIGVLISLATFCVYLAIVITSSLLAITQRHKS